MKRLDRLKQWAGERMGGEVKTTVSEDFRSLEAEMQVRHEGMEKLHSTMNNYVKSMTKRKEGEDKEKCLPVDGLAHAMITHGEEFEQDSVFGNCLIRTGQANEKIGRFQDTYVARASESWLESLERSLTQMKEYQAARKRLESRRLAYDATLTKMQKQKKEDFRVEEELRAQRIKYEESQEDVLRRMTDIQESEAESVADLTAFVEAELEYHDRCRDVLLNLKRQWPAGIPSQSVSRSHSIQRTRSHSMRTPAREESPPPPPTPERIPIRSRMSSNDSYRNNNNDLYRNNNNNNNNINDSYRSSNRDRDDDRDFVKPSFSRVNSASSTFEGPSARNPRSVVEPPPLPVNRSLRNNAPLRAQTDNVFASRYDNDSGANSPERFDSDYSAPNSRNGSVANLLNQYNNNSGSRNAPPPPPVSRNALGSAIAKKPPPPPLPQKRPSLVARGGE